MHSINYPCLQGEMNIFRFCFPECTVNTDDRHHTPDLLPAPRMLVPRPHSRNPRWVITNPGQNAQRTTETSGEDEQNMEKHGEETWAWKDTLWLLTVGILIFSKKGVNQKGNWCQAGIALLLSTDFHRLSGWGEQTTWAELRCTADVVPLFSFTYFKHVCLSKI